jgi:putative ABC transport system ATP-binding protein
MGDTSQIITTSRARRVAPDDADDATQQPSGPPVLQCANVSYRYTPEGEWAVRQVALTLLPGESVALTGPSGCGKSTLLLLCAGVLPLADGSAKVCGQELVGMSANKRADVRRTGIGLVFQFGELVAELSLRDNVALVAELSGAGRVKAREQASSLLDEVGLAPVADALPGAVSGGQAQRCAVARALVARPSLVLADEPTGALDQENAHIVLNMLLTLCHQRRAGLLIATHDPATASACSRQLRMLDGRI